MSDAGSGTEIDGGGSGAGGAGFVEGNLQFAVRTSVKPVTGSSVAGGRVTQSVGQLEWRKVTIRDGRTEHCEYSLEREGFQLVDHPTRVRDFLDPEEVRTVYYPEIERLVMKLSGAVRVLIFDHTLRSGDEGAQEALKLREPVSGVHNDYTEWSGPQRLRDLLPREEAEAYLRDRVAVIQVWRPIQAVVARSPLAMCDARSMAFDDLVAAERRHPNRIGEIYQVAFNPAQRWTYFSHMRRDEALVFKCYDSETDGRARFTAHASFEDPRSPADAPPRESIEVRALALWGGGM